MYSDGVTTNVVVRVYTYRGTEPYLGQAKTNVFIALINNSIAFGLDRMKPSLQIVK